MIVILLLLVFGMGTAAPQTAFAVEPSEVLVDAALEARARAISKELRCVVCRNQSIDDSNADLARDLRVLLRERLVAGDSDEEAVQYLVDRYGTYIMLKPPFGTATLLLWFGPALLLLAAFFGFYRLWRGGAGAMQSDLPAPDRAALASALKGEELK